MSRTVRFVALLSMLLFSIPLIIRPVAAQSSSLLDWIPAEVNGFVRLDTRDPAFPLEAINLALYGAFNLQIARAIPNNAVDYDVLFPLDALDVEGATFAQVVLPWLGDEWVIAYRNLDANLAVAPEDTLMLIGASDPFVAVNTLAAVLQAQDLLERTTYRSMTIYEGDQTSIAFVASAVLVGGSDLVRAAIDASVGETSGLLDVANRDLYERVAGDLTDETIRTPVTALLHGEAAIGAFAFALGGGERGQPVLTALGEALQSLEEASSVEAALLQGNVSAAAISLSAGNLLQEDVQARVIFQTEAAFPETTSTFDTAVLTYLPRNAAFVHAGVGANRLTDFTLATLPMANFLTRALSGFPLTETAASQADALSVPSGADIIASLDSFRNVLNDYANVDLNSLLDSVGEGGSYALALLPNPNNPVLEFGIPFDMLLVAQVAEPTAFLDAASSLAAAYLGEDGFATAEINDLPARTLTTPDAAQPFLTLAADEDDGLLLIGTGTALDTALRAADGDNRLINEARWQDMNVNGQAYLYADATGIYNALIPTQGGQRQLRITQAGLTTQTLSDGLYQIDLTVGLNLN